MLGALEFLAQVYNSYSLPPASRVKAENENEKTTSKCETSPSPDLPLQEGVTTIEEADTTYMLGTLAILFGLLVDS
jgi:hypothetical protein